MWRIRISPRPRSGRYGLGFLRQWIPLRPRIQPPPPLPRFRYILCSLSPQDPSFWYLLLPFSHLKSIVFLRFRERSDVWPNVVVFSGINFYIFYLVCGGLDALLSITTILFYLMKDLGIAGFRIYYLYFIYFSFLV